MRTDATIGAMALLLGWAAAIAIYFLPTYLARRDRMLIFLVNCIPGIGFLIACVLAILSRREDRSTLTIPRGDVESWNRVCDGFPARPAGGMPTWLTTALVAFTLLGGMYVVSSLLAGPSPRQPVHVKRVVRK